MCGRTTCCWVEDGVERTCKGRWCVEDDSEIEKLDSIAELLCLFICWLKRASPPQSALYPVLTHTQNKENMVVGLHSPSTGVALVVMPNLAGTPLVVPKPWAAIRLRSREAGASAHDDAALKHGIYGSSARARWPKRRLWLVLGRHGPRRRYEVQN